ncbi:MAG: alpha/beta hydrolase [Actinomycetota bacterium]|nr:alpha/beta hydrolase [Rubrobacteraceae bacterium]MDQ3497127.1 alpha/beta hydrolase [Actinomycetota bacterium]
MLGRILVLLAALSLGYCGVGLLVVLWMTSPRRKTPEATPASVGLEYTEVEIRSTDGVSLRSWWVPVEGSSLAAVLVPGWGGYKFDEHLLQTVPVYHGAGYSVLLLDLRAQGESGGARRTLGYREVRDVRGALAWLRRQGYALDQVVLHGWSMGGATALRAAPGAGVAAVVEEAGYADLPRLLKGEIPDFVRFGRLLRPAILLAGRLFPDFDPWDVVPKKEAAKLSDEGVPLFIIHSIEDDIVPYEQASMLAAAYPEASVWKLEGYGHVEAYEHPEYAQRLRAFLDASR